MASEGDLTKKLEIKMQMLGIIKNDIPKVLHINKMEELEILRALATCEHDLRCTRILTSEVV